MSKPNAEPGSHEVGKEGRGRALALTSDWLRVTLSSIGDAVVLTDAEGRVTFLNAVAESLTGWTQDEAVGAPLESVFRIVNEETRASVESPAARALREGVVVGLANHTVLIAKDGTERSIDDSAAPIREPNGPVAGVVLVFRDIGERRQLEREKAAALAQARAVLASLRDPYLVLDGDLKVESANDVFYRAFHKSPAETIGRSVDSLGVGPWNDPGLRKLLDEISAQRDSFEDVEVDVESPNAVSRVYRVSGRRLRVAHLPERPSVLVVMEDVTERNRLGEALRRSELRYRRLFQSAKDGILILDAETGKIIDANAFIAGLTGQELSEMLGKELHEIGLFRDVTANKEAFRRLHDGGYVRYEHLPIQNKSGRATEVEFVSNVYREGDHLVAQCNIRDISARVAMEQQIQAQSQALADQHRRKDEFMAMLAHELRNPLAPIRSATHLLRIQEGGSENLIAKQAREVIERQVASLTRLVSDLLEIARITGGRIRLRCETLDLGHAVQHAVESVAPLVARNGQTLTTSMPDPADGLLWVHADAVRLEQVFVNLLTNAIKFTEPGGAIAVIVERKLNHAVVHVRDPGAGIAPDVLPHIFDLFVQGDRTRHRSDGGLGIGLSVVQRIVELHGGTVEAASDGPGKGSEFTVRLPIAPAPGTPAAPIASAQDQPVERTLRVLVVDDNVDGCEMMAHVLRADDYAVQTAYDGAKALELTMSWRPDVVLLDIGLPLLDGYEVARRVRAEPALNSVRLVATTGYGNERDLQLARESGFDAHLVKPVDLEALTKLLHEWDRKTLARRTGPAS